MQNLNKSRAYQHHVSAMPDLHPSATYKGDATGKYAIPGEAGHFTAKASLTAKFGSSADTLSGTIDQFKDSDGNDKTGWSVTLKGTGAAQSGAALAYSGTVADTTDGMTGCESRMAMMPPG